jgi:hypothetical protein
LEFFSKKSSRSFFGKKKVQLQGKKSGQIVPLFLLKKSSLYFFRGQKFWLQQKTILEFFSKLIKFWSYFEKISFDFFAEKKVLKIVSKKNKLQSNIFFIGYGYPMCWIRLSNKSKYVFG